MSYRVAMSLVNERANDLTHHTSHTYKSKHYTLTHTEQKQIENIKSYPLSYTCKFRSNAKNSAAGMSTRRMFGDALCVTIMFGIPFDIYVADYV